LLAVDHNSTPKEIGRKLATPPTQSLIHMTAAIFQLRASNYGKPQRIKCAGLVSGSGICDATAFKLNN